MYIEQKSRLCERCENRTKINDLINEFPIIFMIATQSIVVNYL